MKPTLVTLQGEDVAELLGIDEEDAGYFTGDKLSGKDIDYLTNKYPEYMGLFPVLPAFLTTAFSVGKKVVSAVKSVTGKKKKSPVKAPAPAPAPAPEPAPVPASILAELKKMQQKTTSSSDINKFLPIAAIGLVLMLAITRKR